jgi:hypothetical protein
MTIIDPKVSAAVSAASPPSKKLPKIKNRITLVRIHMRKILKYLVMPLPPPRKFRFSLNKIAPLSKLYIKWKQPFTNVLF